MIELGIHTDNWRPLSQGFEYAVEKGLELGPLAEFDWDRFDPTQATQEEVDNLESPLAAFFVYLDSEA